MKDKTKILAHLLKKWRKQNKISLYQIAKEEGDGLVIDNLTRIESGAGATTKKLLQYLHYCHVHGYDAINELWNIADKKQEEVTEGVMCSKEFDQENRGYQSNILDYEDSHKQSNLLDHASNGCKGVIDTQNTDAKPSNVLSPENCVDATQEHPSKTLTLTPSAFSDGTIESMTKNIQDFEGAKCAEDELKYNSKATPLQEFQEPDLTLKKLQEKQKNGEPLNEEEQLKMLNHLLCPKCGKQICQHPGFIGHVNDDDSELCNYIAIGKLEDPIIHDDFLPEVKPIIYKGT